MPLEGSMKLSDGSLTRPTAQRIRHCCQYQECRSSKSVAKTNYTIWGRVITNPAIPYIKRTPENDHQQSKRCACHPCTGFRKEEQGIAFFTIYMHPLLLPIRTEQPDLEPHHHCVTVDPKGTWCNERSTLITRPGKTSHRGRDRTCHGFAI